MSKLNNKTIRPIHGKRYYLADSKDITVIAKEDGWNGCCYDLFICDKFITNTRHIKADLLREIETTVVHTRDIAYMFLDYPNTQLRFHGFAKNGAYVFEPLNESTAKTFFQYTSISEEEDPMCVKGYIGFKSIDETLIMQLGTLEIIHEKTE